MTPNHYKVPKAFWNSWTPDGRELFNDVYFYMGNQQRFLHPNATLQLHMHWKTTRYNAAWTAADNLSTNQKARKFNGAMVKGCIEQLGLRITELDCPSNLKQKWTVKLSALFNRALYEIEKDGVA